MATTERDYYDVLGVGREASEQEIKSAFRGLARELHPDVSEDPSSDERFREVVEAYEVLSKSETRQLYDRFGHAGLRSGGFRPTSFDLGSLADIFSAFFGDDVFGVATGPRRTRGSDLAAQVEIELEEAAEGVTRAVPFQVAELCETCAGDGVAPGQEPADLPSLRRRRPARAGDADRPRRVRPQPGLPGVLRRGADHRRSLSGVRRRRARAGRT